MKQVRERGQEERTRIGRVGRGGGQGSGQPPMAEMQALRGQRTHGHRALGTQGLIWEHRPLVIKRSTLMLDTTLKSTPYNLDWHV